MAKRPKNCPTCGLVLIPEHTCPPAWEVWLDEPGTQRWETLYANTRHEAACLFVHRHPNKYRASSTNVIVRPVGGGGWTCLTVKMTMRPHYEAQERRGPTLVKEDKPNATT